MNEIKVFENAEFGKIRMVDVDNKPYFVGKDVAEILGYSAPRNAISSHVDEDDRLTHCFSASGQNRTMTIINESGLYSLILSSKLPTAKRFKRWVTAEVLPTIRKTGGYVANDELFINTYLPNADETTKGMFKILTSTINQLNNKIDTQKPLVEFATAVGSTDSLIDMAQFSKLLQHNGIKIGRTRLFSWLRSNKYLRQNNEPYQMYVQNGYFAVREYTYNTSYGEPKIGIKTYLTPKGQKYFCKKFSENLELTG